MRSLRGLETIGADLARTLAVAAEGGMSATIAIGRNNVSFRRQGAEVFVSDGGRWRPVSEKDVNALRRLFGEADRFAAAAHHAEEYDLAVDREDEAD